MKRYLLVLLMGSNFLMAGNSERQDLAMNDIEVVAPEVPVPVAMQPRMNISKLELACGIGLAACSIFLFKKAFAQDGTYHYSENTTFARTIWGIWGAGYAGLSAYMFYWAKQ